MFFASGENRICTCIIVPECASIQCTLRGVFYTILNKGGREVNGHSVLILTVGLTVRVVIRSTSLRSDSYLAVFKTGSFNDYYMNFFIEKY